MNWLDENDPDGQLRIFAMPVFLLLICIVIAELQKAYAKKAQKERIKPLNWKK